MNAVGGGLLADPCCAQPSSATSLIETPSFRNIRAAYLLALTGSLLFFGCSGNRGPLKVDSW